MRVRVAKRCQDTNDQRIAVYAAGGTSANDCNGSGTGRETSSPARAALYADSSIRRNGSVTTAYARYEEGGTAKPDTHADREVAHGAVMASSSAYAFNWSPTRTFSTSMNRLIFASTN